jgi:hypothetical protein
VSDEMCVIIKETPRVTAATTGKRTLLRVFKRPIAHLPWTLADVSGCWYDTYSGCLRICGGRRLNNQLTHECNILPKSNNIAASGPPSVCCCVLWRRLAFFVPSYRSLYDARWPLYQVCTTSRGSLAVYVQVRFLCPQHSSDL